MSSTVDVLTPSELDGLLKVAHHRDLAGLEEQGYSLVGGVRYTTRGHRTAPRGLSGEAILMVGPTRDRAASVVPTAFATRFAIGSESFEKRRLVSRNGALWESPPWELCNDLPGATPRQLDEAHSVALEQVREIFTPQIWAEDVTVEEMAAALAESLKSIEALRLDYMGGAGFGQLTNSARSARRIERWRVAEPPFQS